MATKEEARVLELVASMMRAREQGGTDEDARKLADGQALAKEIWEACQRHHTDAGGSLDTLQCLRSQAITLGLFVQKHSIGHAGRLMIAMEMCEFVLNAALKEDPKP